jgi:hypothetical protein
MPLWPLVPSAPPARWLDGSPIFALVLSRGMSKAIVMGNASGGWLLDVGGINVRRAVGGGEPCLAGRAVWLLPPPRGSGALRGRTNVNGVARIGAAGCNGARIDRDIGSDDASNSNASRICSPSENACDLAMGMHSPMQLSAQRVSRSKSAFGCARGCLLRSTRVRAVHSPSYLEFSCPRAAAVASSSQRLLSECDAWPLVQDQVVLWRAFCSSNSCHRS